MEILILAFKALSDRNRLRIFAALISYEELCACQIIELLQVTGATASRHLGLLITAGLVDSRKKGRWVYYRLHRPHLEPLFEWVKRELVESGEAKDDLKKLKEITASLPEEICKRRKEICGVTMSES